MTRVTDLELEVSSMKLEMVTLKQESDALRVRFSTTSTVRSIEVSYKMFLRKIGRPYQLGTSSPMVAIS